MATKLFFALFVLLIVTMFILMFATPTVGWILFAFVFMLLGGLLVPGPVRPWVVAAAFLLVYLGILLLGIYPILDPAPNRVTIIIGAFMSALSLINLIIVLFTKPKPMIETPAPMSASGAPPQAPIKIKRSPEGPKAPKPLQALQCPACGSPEIEGSYPEYQCAHCSTRFLVPQEN